MRWKTVLLSIVLFIKGLLNRNQAVQHLINLQSLQVTNKAGKDKVINSSVLHQFNTKFSSLNVRPGSIYVIRRIPSQILEVTVHKKKEEIRRLMIKSSRPPS